MSKEARGSGDDPAPTVTEWYKYDHYPAEVFFVPRPGADLAEDDGVLFDGMLSGGWADSMIEGSWGSSQVVAMTHPGQVRGEEFADI